MDIKKIIKLLHKERTQSAIIIGLSAIFLCYSAVNSNYIKSNKTNLSSPFPTISKEKLPDTTTETLSSPSDSSTSKLISCTFPTECANVSYQMSQKACDEAVCCQYKKDKWTAAPSKAACDKLSLRKPSQEALTLAAKIYVYANLKEDAQYSSRDEGDVVLSLADYLTWDPTSLASARTIIQNYEKVQLPPQYKPSSIDSQPNTPSSIQENYNTSSEDINSLQKLNNNLYNITNQFPIEQNTNNSTGEESALQQLNNNLYSIENNYPITGVGSNALQQLNNNLYNIEHHFPLGY